MGNSKIYRDNLQTIDWSWIKTKSKPMDAETKEQLRRDFHAREAEDGKKDAQWYLDNERRVAMRADEYRHRPNSAVFKRRWEEIFGNE